MFDSSAGKVARVAVWFLEYDVSLMNSPIIVLNHFSEHGTVLR